MNVRRLVAAAATRGETGGTPKLQGILNEIEKEIDEVDI